MNSNNISKRTVILFAIFIFLAIFGSLFIYYFRGYADDLVKKYTEELTVCENLLSSQDCFAVESCVGIYGPTCPNCDDSEFKFCQKLPFNVEQAIIKDKKLCEGSDGKWYRNKLGHFCLCDQVGQNKVFDKSLGCVDK